MTSYNFLSLKNDLNVGSKSTVISKKIYNSDFFSCHLEGHGRKYQDPNPDLDPLVRGADPDHTKMSRTRNTDFFLRPTSANYFQWNCAIMGCRYE